MAACARPTTVKFATRTSRYTGRATRCQHIAYRFTADGFGLADASRCRLPRRRRECAENFERRRQLLRTNSQRPRGECGALSVATTRSIGTVAVLLAPSQFLVGRRNSDRHTARRAAANAEGVTAPDEFLARQVNNTCSRCRSRCECQARLAGRAGPSRWITKSTANQSVGSRRPQKVRNSLHKRSAFCMQAILSGCRADAMPVPENPVVRGSDRTAAATHRAQACATALDGLPLDRSALRRAAPAS